MSLQACSSWLQRIARRSAFRLQSPKALQQRRHSTATAETSEGSGVKVNAGGTWSNESFTASLQRADARKQKRDREEKQWRVKLGTVDRSLEQSVAANPRGAMLTLSSMIKRDAVSTNAIRICLEAAYTFSRQHGGLEDPLSVKPLLAYLLEDTSRWLPLVYHDNATAIYICHLAIKADLGSFVEQWILTPLSQAELTQALPYIPSGEWSDSWRGRLLRSLVDAYLWNTPGNADEAISCRVRILQGMRRCRTWDKNEGTRTFEEARQAPRSGPATTSTAAADHRILKALLFHEPPRTKLAQYDSFCTAMRRHFTKFRGDPGVVLRRNVDLALLPLAHPTDPDETVFVNLLRDILSNPEARQSLSNLLRIHLRRPIARSTELAIKKGKSEDAAWLQQLVRRHLAPPSDAMNCESREPARPLVRRVVALNYQKVSRQQW